MTTRHPPPGNPPPAAAPPPGLRVGDYELLARVGEGGMGVVHLARKPGGERVALKVLRPQVVGDDEARQRLAREVNSLRRVRSPRIAEIVDADPWGDIPYVATRYVPGLSLHEAVKQDGPLEEADLHWFARCLAEALAAVHEVGVLHRDIKPSNVLMEGRSPVLIDFGLARLADDPRLTHTGYLLGTPGYLAPEILYGEEATSAADIHSWAATVAYAGTGRGPFGRGPAVAIMDRVRRGEHDLSGLPPEMERIVHACLDPDPDRRPELELVLGWLESPARSPRATRRLASAPAAEEFTLPYAAAVLSGAEEETRHAPEDLDRTWVEDPDPTTAWLETRYDDEDEDTFQAHHEPQYEPYQQPPPIVVAEPWPVRIRRGLLVAVGSVLVGATVAAYPYLAVALVAVCGWILRSVSLAGSAAGDLRRLRGPRWYDGPRVVLASPWHFISAVPGTVVLLCWAGGLALAAGLVCLALGVGLSTGLLIGGTIFGASMWAGPGGSRIRRPMHRILTPVAEHPGAWLVTAAFLVAATAGVGAVAAQKGPDWQPAYSEPLMPGTFLGDLIRR